LLIIIIIVKKIIIIFIISIIIIAISIIIDYLTKDGIYIAQSNGFMSHRKLVI